MYNYCARYIDYKLSNDEIYYSYATPFMDILEFTRYYVSEYSCSSLMISLVVVMDTVVDTRLSDMTSSSAGDDRPLFTDIF